MIPLLSLFAPSNVISAIKIAISIGIIVIIYLIYKYSVKIYESVHTMICINPAANFVLSLAGSDYCDEGPGTTVDPNLTNANYIFQTYTLDGETLYTYEIPDDGSAWYKPAAGIKTVNVKVLDYDGGTNNPDDVPAYHGIEFADNSNSIFKNSSNSNKHNSWGEDAAKRVFELTAPNEKYVKEEKYLYRKQVGKDLVYAVFRRKDYMPADLPNFIFITLNSDGGQVQYAVPEDSMWVDPAYKGIITDNVEKLNYSEKYNGQELIGIQFKNNNSSIFSYSENDNKYNSFNTGGKNNGQSVALIKAPEGYIKESKYLYREKEGGDYIYAVFRKINANVSDNSTTAILGVASDVSPNYIFGTLTDEGNPVYYSVPGDGESWYKPAILRIQTDDVLSLNYGETYNDKFLGGIRFKDNGNSIFMYSSAKNKDNSYNTGGQNNGQSVAVMNPPKLSYIKEDKYLYREQVNGDYIYAVFRLNTFSPPNVKIETKPDGTTNVILPVVPVVLTCGSTTFTNPNYIFQTINENGGTMTYPIIDDAYWTNPDDSHVKNRSYTDSNGKTGILYNNDNKTVFRCSTNDNADNAYKEESVKLVYALVAPPGYTKEPRYMWRDQYGSNYIYAVFKRNTIDCATYDKYLPYICMNDIWKKAGCKTDAQWSDQFGRWAYDKTRTELENDAKLYLNKPICTGIADPSAPPAAPVAPSGPLYKFGTVNSKEQPVYYDMPTDKNYYPNPPPSEITGNRYSGASQIDGDTTGLEYNKDSTLFNNVLDGNDNNAWGNGTHGKKGVKILAPPDPSYTPVGYFYRKQKGPDYSYRVFKKINGFTIKRIIDTFLNR